MNKDKLITVRIEAEKREQFKKWVKEQNLDISEFITTIIQACLDGRLDKNLISNLNPSSDSICIDDLDNKINQLDKKLDIRIDKLEEQVNELITKLDTSIDTSIDTKETIEPTLDEQLTNAELARLLGVSSSTVSRWATKKREPPKNLEWRYDSQLKKWVK
ncbi:MAG: helix-turn-helix domain-containing protein, partial [Crocosphaera sp.]|nr:helix-turn-helix domain-containing protein [Crocosphaera sp.]